MSSVQIPVKYGDCLIFSASSSLPPRFPAVYIVTPRELEKSNESALSLSQEEKERGPILRMRDADDS